MLFVLLLEELLSLADMLLFCMSLYRSSVATCSQSQPGFEVGGENFKARRAKADKIIYGWKFGSYFRNQIVDVSTKVQRQIN